MWPVRRAGTNASVVVKDMQLLYITLQLYFKVPL